MKFYSSNPNRKEYLYRLSNLSENLHIEEYLTDQIKDVINSIRSSKFFTIISDNIRNIKKTWEIINNEYPSIQNVWCIAHCINFLAYDIVKHNFADNFLKRVNIFVIFFKNIAISNNR